MPQGTEVAFVTSIQKDLNARFPTPQAAEKAGYFRFGNEDEDGAISYANLKWQSGNPQEPSQLWYDVHGNLLGADFSVLQSGSPEPPAIWGVNYPALGVVPRAHPLHSRRTQRNRDLRRHERARSSPLPAATSTIRRRRRSSRWASPRDAATVKRVFLFPSIWDLIVWVKPNPNGAFAERIRSSSPAPTPTKATCRLAEPPARLAPSRSFRAVFWALA